jgi:hypothetical protein
MKDIINPLIEIVPRPKQPLVNREFRSLITALEEKIKSLPGALIGDCFPLKHSFAEGIYIRTLLIPKGYFVVGKLHKDSYLNCFMSGEMTILTEEGIKHIKGPCSMVSPAETKRFGYSHEQVIWITVHPNPTNTMDIKKLEKEIHVEDYDELNQVIDIERVDAVFNDFIKQVGYDYPFVFRELTKKIYAHEKPGFWSDWTEEQQKLYISGDWESFSRSRGYTEEEIDDVRIWIRMLEEGEKQGYKPLDIIRDLSAGQAFKNIGLDKRGEILKSSHIPSSKKIPYKEEICLV